MSLSSKYIRPHAGFTLVELIMTIGIAMVILATVVSSQSNYSDVAALQNLANTISLTLRQAQIYGISVKEFTPGSNNFSVAYGVDFDILPSGGNNAYISFADIPQGSVYNGTYDSGWSCPIGGSSECITKNVIANGDTISSLCEIPLSGPKNCSIGRVDITFLRPEINANMVFFDTSGNQLSLSGVKGALINLVSPNAATSSVSIYTTGQISVQ